METMPQDYKSSPLHLETLIMNAVRHMEELGYSLHTIQEYSGVWRRLSRCTGSEVFSQEAVNRFLKCEGMPEEALENPSLVHPNRRSILTALRILQQYAFEGIIHSHHYVRKIKVSENFAASLKGYKDFCIDNRKYSPNVVHQRIYDATKFLQFLSNRGVIEVSEIQAEHLSEFLKSQTHLSPVTLKGIVRSLRSLMGYLWISGTISKDLSQVLPKIRLAKDAHIPTVWSHKEVSATLSAVDRSSPKGKRDYAILLLACRLGLRSIDIRQLRLENLRWEESQIEIEQSKTKTPLLLPLTEELGQSLIDYLRYGRPQSAHREIFLRLRPPFEPVSNSALWCMFKFYRRRAGVTDSRHGHHGLHSLRHTLATRLMECNTPIQTISSVLGHGSMESTNIYLKVDISALRSAALSPDSMDLEEVNHA